ADAGSPHGSAARRSGARPPARPRARSARPPLGRSWPPRDRSWRPRARGSFHRASRRDRVPGVRSGSRRATPPHRADRARTRRPPASDVPGWLGEQLVDDPVVAKPHGLALNQQRDARLAGAGARALVLTEQPRPLRAVGSARQVPRDGGDHGESLLEALTGTPE